MKKRVLWSMVVLLLAAAPAMAAGGGSTCTTVADISPTNGQTVPDFTNGSATVVQLNGQPSKDAASYSWVQTGGPSVVLSDYTVAKPTFKAPDVGPSGATLTFELTVKGCTPEQKSKKTTTVAVTNANKQPVAVATILGATAPFSVNEGTVVTLDGSYSSDPDPGDTLTYSWAQVIDPNNTTTAVTITPNPNNGGKTATFTAPPEQYPNGETLTFRLTVSDGSLSNSADIRVNILSVNQPPVASISCPATIAEGAQFTLDGSLSSDPDNGSLAYQWSQVTGVPNADLTGVDMAAQKINLTAPVLVSYPYDTMKFGLTVTDNGKLSSSSECDVKVLDVTPPVISGAGNITKEATSALGAVAVFAPEANDAFYGKTDVSCDPVSGSTFKLGDTKVTCNASDKATPPNTATVNFTVTVNDTTPPQVTVPANMTAEATGPSGAAVTFSASAWDVVDGSITPTCLPASGSTYALGSTKVTCSAKDAHNNSGSASFNVSVQDTTPPVISAHGNETAEATSASGAIVTYASPATIDAVDGAGTATCAPASGSQFALGDTNVTCNASDKAGNAATATTFKVSVKDTTPPAVTAPADVIVEATGPQTAVVIGTATATDAVGVVSLGSDAPATFPVATTTVTWTAKDAAGNAGTATQKITVKDTTPPVIAGVPANMTAEATGPGGAVVSYTAPTASDLVDGVVTVTCDKASGSTFALGDTTVNCSASDKAGNNAAASFKVTVKDTTPPVISAHGNETAEATSASGAIVTYASPATIDVVDGAGTATCAPASGSQFALGDTNVTCNASDKAGNAATATTFKVSVKDTTPPAVTAPADVIVEATGPQTAVVIGTATATDAVGVVSLGSDAPATFPVATTTVTWTAKDAAGNAGTAKQKVTVKDTTPPVITFAGTINNGDSFFFGAVPGVPTCSATDIVSGSVSCKVTGYNAAVGTYALTAAATDGAGNTATSTRTYTVRPWTLSGFYSPVDMNGITNTVKGGSTVPLKFEVFSGATELTTTSSISSIQTQSVACATMSSTEDLIDALATGGTSLRYDTTAGQFVYNWQTPKQPGTCYIVTVTTLDGSKISANFKLK